MEKGGTRKESLKAFLITTPHVALQQCCLILYLAKKIWATQFQATDPRGLCCLSPESSAQCEHILPSKITDLLLLAEIA